MPDYLERSQSKIDATFLYNVRAVCCTTSVPLTVRIHTITVGILFPLLTNSNGLRFPLHCYALDSGGKVQIKSVICRR